jgi:hypothetical protein
MTSGQPAKIALEKTLIPAVWNIGEIASPTSRLDSLKQSAIAPAIATRMPWVWIAAFGVPVVPDV